MKRRLLLLNVVLLACITAGVYSLKQHAEEAKAHEAQILNHKIPVAPPPVLPPAPAPAPVPATNYIEMASKVLFVRDRSPNPIIDPPKPAPVKKMPALPFAYGIMDFGEGPTVIMAEKSGVAPHGYHVGDTIGEFKLMAVTGRELTLEWDGKETIKKKLEDLEDKSAAQAAQIAAANTAPAAAAPPPPKKPDLPPEPKPGLETGAGFKACRDGDTAPNGTIADGYKKVVSVSPFGQHCTWVPVNSTQ